MPLAELTFRVGVGTNFGASQARVYVGGLACANLAHNASTPHTKLSKDVLVLLICLPSRIALRLLESRCR